MEESYPGREYHLHFAAGETAKYLVIDPKYSEASDGDCTVMLILKNEPEDYVIPGDFNTRGINIVDEDEQEEITVSMAFPEVTAENGEVSLKITRSGSINNVAGVRVTSYDGSAVMGDDYGGVGANLYFPMGITERTIELPVGHGSEQKDFNVSITPLNGETIGIATTHVLIPPASVDGGQEAVLQDDLEVGDAWNLKDRKNNVTGNVKFPSDYTAKMTTVDDKLETQYFSLKTDRDYAWDGVFVEYDFYTWYAKGIFKIEKWTTQWEKLMSKDWGDLDEKWKRGQTATAYFGSPKAPNSISVDDRTYEVHNGFRDSYTELHVNGVYPIKRQFTVNLDKATPLDFEGVSDKEEAERVAVMMDDRLKSQVKLWTGDNFSVSKPIGQNYTRLTDVVAVTDSGRTYSIKNYMSTASESGYSYSAGMSDTFVIELTPELINFLANRDCIKWSSKDNSYSGTIHFRPVFDYSGNVTVSVRNTAEGNLQMNGKAFQNKTYHLGDQLTFTPNRSSEGISANMYPCGVGFVSRSGGASGKLIWRSECDYFVDQKITYELTTDYYEFWQVFTHKENMIQVQVPTDQLQYFNTDAGLFKEALSRDVNGGYTVFTVKKNVLTNELTELWARSKDDSGVPVWTLGSGRTRYSGAVFYFYTDATIEENLVTLTMDRTANHAVYGLSGSICSAVMNLSTGQPSEELAPSENASVMMGDSGIMTDENGAFALAPQTLVGDTTVRYLVSYNGIVSLKETRLAPATAATQEMTYLDGTGKTVTAQGVPVTLGAIQADSFSTSGAHFTGVTVEQTGILGDVLNVLELNGKELTVKVYADPGQKYIFDGQEYTEEIKDVTLYFQNQLTGEVHGIYSTSEPAKEPAAEGTEEEQQAKKDKTPALTWDAEKNVATLNVKKFSPDDADEYTYGDVLVARLTTDKRTVKTTLTGQNMVYDPVSTGLAVITDRDYEPETYDYNLDVPTLLNVNVDDDGNLMDDKNRNSFGKFPFLGEITSTIKVFTLFKKALKSDADYVAEEIADDLEEMDDGGLAEDDAELMWNPLAGKEIAMSALLRIKETPYGGVRIMFAVVASTAIGSYKSVLNPRAAKNYYSHMKYGIDRPASGGDSNNNGIDYIYDAGALGDKAAGRFTKSEMTGPYARFSLFVGIYMDFGYIQEVRADGTKTELSKNVVYMGAGGFIGGQVGVGYTWQIFPFGIPCYINLEGNVSATLFLGSSADPQKTLEEYNQTNNHKGSDFAFNVELLMQGNIGATGGLGLYKTIGAHITLSAGVEAGYNKQMPVWYENATDWGFTTNITISGGIDCNFKGINFSVDFGSVSWPLPLDYGFMAFAQQARRGTMLLTTLYQDIDGIKDQEVKDTLWAKIIPLGEAIDHYTVNDEQLKRMVNDLRDYAYNHDIISWAEKQRINITSGTGVFFAVWDSIQFCDGWDDFWPLFKKKKPMNVQADDAVLEEDNAPRVGAELLAALDAQEQRSGDLRVNTPTASSWVAGQSGELMSAFGAVSSERIVEDAVSQPSSQIMGIGGNRFLVVYRSEIETSAGGRSTVLMYSIYNAKNGSWTKPQMVQDEIGDSKPSLTDAGDKLILTWASDSQEKYDSYVQQIQAQGLTLEEAVAKDPTGAAATQDIFVAEFDKAGAAFTSIEQITDDQFCDDFPQAVYDSETGDYIVLYYKTAQDTGAYDTAKDAVLDMIGASPDPDKTYSVLCYMLHNNQTEAQDTNGLTHEAGWARDYLFPNETTQTPEQQAAFLQSYGGQRFLPSALRAEDGGQTDEPIVDMTAAPGYNGLAAFAFTVDKDLQLTTSEDRELFMQFYDFAEHKTYIPIKIAGAAEKEALFLKGDMKSGHYETGEVTEQVNVGSPKLIRSGGDTWLFWREDNENLKYLDVSELLNDKVAKVANPASEADLTWALQADGTFATDAESGEVYKPDIQTVDFGSALTNNAIHITDYQVITDQQDNLYVVWSDTTPNGAIKSGKDYEASMALEIYASAKIKENNSDRTGSEDEASAETARWSKPYRLTRDNKYNDGTAIALSDEGDLLIMHNQYEKLPIDSEETLTKLVSEGKVAVEMIDGEPYVKGSTFYDSPISLMMTRCEPIGSVEATQFEFSDDTPEPGQKVNVTAILENTGLTSAEGCKVDFYEYKDGKQGKRIHSITDDKGLTVNTAKKTTFEWTAPSEGVEGYSIQAVVSEKKAGALGGYYNPVETFSGTFQKIPEYDITLDSCVQNGDVFDVKYEVTNTGNEKAKDGTEANLYLKGLYGDLKEQYGMDDNLLIQEDISGLAPGETRTVEKSISLPVSVFEYCGYDAVQAVVHDNEGEDLADTDHQFITLDEPLNLQLNGGSEISLAVGESAAAPATYDSTPFMDMGGANATKAVYTVADPAIALVDENGNVTALGKGTTTLTATLLPSGRSASVKITVKSKACAKDDSCPMTPFTDANKQAWYHDGVHWAIENGIMNGTGDHTFEPMTDTSRGMIVTMLWRMEGSPNADKKAAFKDVPDGKWFADAVHWAAANGIVEGYNDSAFGPMDPVTREQIVTILYRYAQFKGLDVSKGGTAYLNSYTDANSISEWAVKAFRWAVDAGIIQGMSDTLLSPKTSAVRAQVATMLMRYSNLAK